MKTSFSSRKNQNSFFFDSLHIATALNSDLILLTSDSDAIDNIKRENGIGINILEY